MRISDLPARAAMAFVRAYAYAVSPLMAGKCRFHPTCSAYAHQALSSHGLWRGGFLAVKRLLRCHPWHRGPMVDPVPVNIDWPAILGYKQPQTKPPENCGQPPCDKKDETPDAKP